MLVYLVHKMIILISLDYKYDKVINLNNLYFQIYIIMRKYCSKNTLLIEICCHMLYKVIFLSHRILKKLQIKWRFYLQYIFNINFSN